MMSSVSSRQPAFVIGVTGHLRLHPDDVPRIELELRLLFSRLVAPVGSAGVLDGSGQVVACDHPLMDQIPALGLAPDSLVLLSSLAPGADQVAANVAFGQGIRVMAPLPFPDQLPDAAQQQQYSVALYRNLTTFCWPDGTPAGNADRQAAFDHLLGRIRPEDRFLVRLPGDAELSAEDLAVRLALQAADEQARNRRFRAAGEYIASGCDLLVAICSEDQRPCVGTSDPGNGLAQPMIPDDAECGAGAIVRTRLFGTTPGLLPDISALTWSDNGPMIRIWARNCGRGMPADTVASAAIPPTALWSPESSQLVSQQGEVDADRERRQLLMLAEQVTRLRRVPASSLMEPSSFADLTDLAPESLGASERLQQLALFYQRANSSSLLADSQMKRMQRSTPWLSLAGFLLLQCSDNLQLTDSSSWGARTIPLLTMLLSLLLFAVPWIWAYWLRKTGQAAQQEDDRALAEALRVQFYWALSGVGKSAAQHYQKRERGELLWIRAAVSSAVMPVAGFHVEFQRLDLPLRTQRLTAVLDGWLRNQQRYFYRAVVAQRSRLTKLHVAAQLLLWSGLSLLISCSPLGRGQLERFLATDHPALVRALLISIPVLLAAWMLLKWPGAMHGRPFPRQWPEKIHCVALQLLTSYPVLIVFGFWLACGLVTLIGGLPAVLGSLAGTLSGVQLSLVIVCRNMCFAGCAVVAACIAFHFLPQNVPRYQSMLELYRGAALRMEALLERLQRQTSEADRQQALRSIHSLLEELGSEALVENAEWLRMHRISPRSPLVPSP
ncbi:MAG: hypothetical protein ACKO2P_12630 [Planctomycetota bacterium]